MALFPDEMLKETYKDRPIVLRLIIAFDFLVFLMILPIAVAVFALMFISREMEWRRRKKQMIEDTLRQAKGKG